MFHAVNNKFVLKFELYPISCILYVIFIHVIIFDSWFKDEVKIYYEIFISKVPGAPGHVKALVMTSDSILVTWTRPLEPNGIIIKYYIYIQHPNKVS